jgi:hypothetical protein
MLLAFPGAILAQTSTPPVKMGLWKTTNVITVTGMQIPPDIAARLQAMGKQVPTGQPQTTVVQSCLTPERWQQSFGHMQRNKNCEYTHTQQTSSAFSTDVVCKSADGSYTAKGHVEVNFVTTVTMHGKAHMETVSTSQTKPIVMDMNFDSTYQSADCQGVSPDSPKIEH